MLYFSLSPQSEQVLFSRIEIKILKQLQSIRLIGVSGEVTEINFSNFKRLDREDSYLKYQFLKGLISLDAEINRKYPNWRTMRCLVYNVSIRSRWIVS